MSNQVIEKRLNGYRIRAQRFNRRRFNLTAPQSYHANDTSAYVPEMWANEAVQILYESMKFGATVHRDFDEEIGTFGETVHTRKNAEFVGKRKQNDLDDLEDQDAVASTIDVVLNQRVYVSFLLGDRERTVSFKNLVETFLVEAIQAQGRVLDRVIGCQAYQFLGNVAGGLGQLTKNTSHDYLLDMREVFNENKVPEMNRWLALCAKSETNMQKTDLFKSAERIGDAGQALRNAYLGQVAGWDTFLELNTPSVRNATVDTSVTGTVSGAQEAGTTSFDLSAATGLITGQYIVVAGDYTPLRVTNISTNTLTLNRGLRYNVAASAAVTAYETALVNQASAIAAGDKNPAVSNGYPIHWQKEIVYDGTGTPKQGQLVSFKTSGGTVLSQEYGIVQVNTTAKTILLDRPLEASIDDNAIICLGPSGDYNLAYQRNAIALVNRPLVLPPENAGARAANGYANNMALRAAISWDGKKEATRVTISALFGVAVLDSARGGVLLG